MKQMDNHWIGESVMKSVDDESSQRRKDIKEGGEEKKMILIWRF